MLKLNFDKVFWVLNFPLCKSLYIELIRWWIYDRIIVEHKNYVEYEYDDVRNDIIFKSSFLLNLVLFQIFVNSSSATID